MIGDNSLQSNHYEDMVCGYLSPETCKEEHAGYYKSIARNLHGESCVHAHASAGKCDILLFYDMHVL